MKVCPQCRISLTGKLSRNRVIENLARKIKEGLTFYYTSTVKSVVQNSESKLSWLWLGGVVDYELLQITDLLPMWSPFFLLRT